VRHRVDSVLSFFSSRLNWYSPPPHPPQARVYPPPPAFWFRGGGHIRLKGQCHEIFDFWFFSWISFPQASEYTTTAILNFFENSRRYSRLKVHHRCQRHRWQMEKIFKQKYFNNFVWAPLGCRVINIYINFCLQVYFKVSAA
jgi:hypothetical protein